MPGKPENTGYTDIFDPPFPFLRLLAFTAECCALRLPALAGISSGNPDMLCLAVAVFIKGTLHRPAGYIRILGGIIHGASYPVPAALPEADTAGIPGMSCPIPFHLDVILAAAFLLVIHTTGYRAI